jgi:hypothetical protein
VKILNEKGKLFGIINVIDLAILIIILLIAGAAAYKVIGNTAENSDKDKKDIYVTIRCRLNKAELADNIKPGDRFLTGTNYVNGTISSVTLEDAYDTVDSSDGTIKWEKHPVLKDIVVVVKMHENPDDPILNLGTQEIRIGKSIFMKTQRVELIGVIEKIVVAD